MGFTPSGGGLIIAGFQISSAQILSAFTTPVPLLPAPGAGLAIIPVFATFNYRFGGAAYVPGTAGNLVISTPSFGPFQVAATGLIDQVASQIQFRQNGSAGVFPITSLVNQAWQFSIQTANPTAGNGTLGLSMVYYLQPVS